MITDTEGIVLRQVRTVGGRRMILLFSRKFGKINVGTSINEGGKNKSALAVRPFTNGRYELFKGRESYNLNSGQVLQSFYRIGEDLDKYMAASYVLELTEKLLPEEMAQPRLYQLLLDFLEEMEQREKKHGTCQRVLEIRCAARCLHYVEAVDLAEGVIARLVVFFQVVEPHGAYSASTEHGFRKHLNSHSGYI